MIDQIGIAVFGVTAIVLANLKSAQARKWAPILGLAGQVFWVWMSISEQLWGILFMSFVYSGAWMLGVYNYWFAEKDKKVGI